MSALTVACVLEYHIGCDFDVEYVDKLERAVRRHLPMPHQFVCFSNVEVPCERIPLQHGWPGWWAKMEMYSPHIPDGRILYFDLDTLIVGDLSDIAAIDEFAMTCNFLDPENGLGAGVMMIEDRQRVWNAFRPKAHIAQFRSDQEFLNDLALAKSFDDLVPGQVISYKRDVRRQDVLPADARVVSFHGKPRPHQLPDDHWIRQHWQAA